MPDATISVVTPAYNDAGRVGDAVRSIRDQTFTDWEMIVIDDGSTDGTADAARAAAEGDPRVTVVSKPNGGLSSARNAGLARARGAFIHFLDSDDWLEPTCLAELHAALAADPDAALAACSYWAASDDRTLLEIIRTPSIPDPRAAFARTCAFPVHAALTRTALVREAGGFDETLPACEDWDLWARIAATGRPFATIPGALAVYRRRSGSMSRDPDRMARAMARVIPQSFGPDEHWEMVDALASSLFYYWGGAVVQNRDATRMWDAAPDLRGWNFDAANMAQVVISGIVYACGGDQAPLADLWRGGRETARVSLDALAARIGHARDCDLLFAQLDARLCASGAHDLRDLAMLRPEALGVLAVGDGGRAMGAVEMPKGFSAIGATLAASIRETPPTALGHIIAQAAQTPIATLRQVLSRQPERPSRAAALEALRGAAARARAARFDAPKSGVVSTGSRGKGAPRLRMPILVAQTGPLAAAHALTNALDVQGWSADAPENWTVAMRTGIAPRGRAYVLAASASLAPETDPMWAALCATGAPPLIFLPLNADDAPAPGWTMEGARGLRARGARFGWAAPRTAPDLETEGRLAEVCAKVAARLRAINGDDRCMALVAPGGGARFFVERLREAGFSGAIGLLPGATHLDDPAFDMRRVRIDLGMPTNRLVRSVTGA